MSNDNLRAAITAALRRRDPNADLDVSPTCTPLGAWVSLAGGVIRGPDGAVIDVVARAGDDAKALRGVAFAVGLRDDGSDPAEEVHRLRAELAETERRLNAEISAMDARDGAYQALDGARDGSDELVALAECRMAEIGRLRTDNARLDDVAKGALDDLAAVRRERDEARRDAAKREDAAFADGAAKMQRVVADEILGFVGAIKDNATMTDGAAAETLRRVADLVECLALRIRGMTFEVASALAR